MMTRGKGNYKYRTEQEFYRFHKSVIHNDIITINSSKYCLLTLSFHRPTDSHTFAVNS